MLVSRQQLADTLGVTYTAVMYLVKRGRLDENVEKMIDTDHEKTIAVVMRYARQQTSKAGGRRKKEKAPRGSKHYHAKTAANPKGGGPPPSKETSRWGRRHDLPTLVKPTTPVNARDCAALAVQYADDVTSGRIVAGKLARLACTRFQNDLARQNTPDFPYVFDADVANKRCALIERMPHIKGRWAKGAEFLVLESWQAFFTCNIFGWVHVITRMRRFREVYGCVPRKNAKSTLAAAIGNVLLLDDDEHGAEVYAGATTEKQAWEVFGPARLMLKNSPSIMNQFNVQVWAKSLVKADDNSKFWPIVGKPGDGASPSCAIVDEYHEHPTSDLVDTMVTGMGAREQPLLLIITTAGANLASPCYDKHKEAEKILNGTFTNDELFTIIYTIDEGDEWTDPATLRKVNPNIGVSVDEQFLLAQQRQAIQNPSYQTRFKTKHLNIWCQASVAGIDIEQWKKCGDPSLKLERFKGEECWASLDLASKIDICDKVYLFRRQVADKLHYYAFAKHYLPERTVEESHVNGNAYRKWVIEGRIVATPGAEVDFDVIRDEVKADSMLYSIREVVYDPWRATQLAHQLATDGAVVVEMAQNPKNMGEAFDELTSAIKAGRFHHDGDPVLEWMASNVVARTVAKGLVVPGKDSIDAKIDGIVAIVMGVSRSLAAPAYGMMDWLSEAVAV